MPQTTRSEVEKRFERIERGIDSFYGLAYMGLDAFFTGLDHVFDRARKRALDAVTPTAPVEKDNPSLSHKAAVVIEDYRNRGKDKIANLMQKQFDAGLFDVAVLNGLYESIKSEDDRW